MLPCGTRSFHYEEDIAIVRTRAQWGMLIAFLIILFTLPLYGNVYILSILSMAAIVLIAVQGLNLLTGYCGQLSVGQAAFVGVGAYITAILTTRFGVPWLAALISAGLGAGLVGIIFGLPALKIKGFYLAMTTLAAQFILDWCFLHLREWTGGVSGLGVDNASIGGIVFASEQSKYYLIMIITFVMVFFAKNIARTRVGRAFVAIKDNDLAANVMGINLRFYKLLAFFLCCGFAGVAGSLLAQYMNLVNPAQFSLGDSILYLGMLVVGGMGSITGGIFGTVFFQLLSTLTLVLSPLLYAVFPGLGMVASSAMTVFFYAIIIMLFLIFEPRGINHVWLAFKGSYRLYPFAYQ